MIDLIKGKVAPLAAHPAIGRTGRKRGTHELVAYESYVLIYRMLIIKIEVVRLKHRAQQWRPGTQ